MSAHGPAAGDGLVLGPGGAGARSQHDDGALIGLLEFVHLAGLSRFPKSQQELEELMRPWSEKIRGLAYKIRRAL